MIYTGNLDIDIYNCTMEKIASMEKDAGPFLSSLARSTTRARGFKPSIKPDAVRNFIAPAINNPVDNVVVPGLKGYFGSGLVNGPKPKMVRKAVDVVSKVPGLKWTGKVNRAMDWLDKAGKSNLPDNPIAKKVNEIARGVASYDDYLGWGTPVAVWGGSTLGNLLA